MNRSNKIELSEGPAHDVRMFVYVENGPKIVDLSPEQADELALHLIREAGRIRILRARGPKRDRVGI
jgi:hypothetical protein